MIDIQELSFRYAGGDQAALADIDIHIPRGQFCGLVGANEAGKSTLCYALAGFIPHFYRGELKGRITVDGIDTRSSSLGELSAIAGLVFQNPFNQITGARFTVRDEIAFGLENLGLEREEMMARIAQVSEAVDLNELLERSPLALSGGQQQRVAVASIMAMQPKVLVLDEPSSQLDPRSTEELFAALKALTDKSGTTVVLAEHKLEWVAEFADRVLALKDGRLVADGPAREVLADLGPETGATRYTRAARAARAAGLLDDAGALPVTLGQAREVFG